LKELSHKIDKENSLTVLRTTLILQYNCVHNSLQKRAALLLHFVVKLGREKRVSTVGNRKGSE
jgi:hypothetical protein